MIRCSIVGYTQNRVTRPKRAFDAPRGLTLLHVEPVMDVHQAVVHAASRHITKFSTVAAFIRGQR